MTSARCATKNYEIEVLRSNKFRSGLENKSRQLPTHVLGSFV